MLGIECPSCLSCEESTFKQQMCILYWDLNIVLMRTNIPGIFFSHFLSIVCWCNCHHKCSWLLKVVMFHLIMFAWHLVTNENIYYTCYMQASLFPMSSVYSKGILSDNRSHCLFKHIVILVIIVVIIVFNLYHIHHQYTILQLFTSPGCSVTDLLFSSTAPEHRYSTLSIPLI